MYIYKAIVTSVHDGDTVRADIDLGFGIWIKNQPLRFYGINAPELKGETKEAALKTRDRLKELLLNKEIIIETINDKKEKYGRWLAKITCNNILINELLIQEKLAVKYLDS
jgi:micrococcal nuclease